MRRGQGRVLGPWPLVLLYVVGAMMLAVPGARVVGCLFVAAALGLSTEFRRQRLLEGDEDGTPAPRFGRLPRPLPGALQLVRSRLVFEKLRGQPGFALALELRCRERMDRWHVLLRVRLRNRSGRLLRSFLPRYRDHEGRFQVFSDHVEPVPGSPVHFRIGVWFPISTLEQLVPQSRFTGGVEWTLEVEGRALLDGVEEIETELYPRIHRPREEREETLDGQEIAGDDGEPAILEIVRVEGLEGLCQICGDRLSGALVRCGHCGTEHHRECWRYLRGCSTFGCLGTPDQAWRDRAAWGAQDLP